MYIYTYIHMYIYTYIHIYTYTYIYVYIYIGCGVEIGKLYNVHSIIFIVG